MKIKNINPKFGDSIEFDGDDLPGCIANMATCIVACEFEDFPYTVNDLCCMLRADVDYEVAVQ